MIKMDIDEITCIFANEYNQIFIITNYHLKMLAINKMAFIPEN